MKKVPSCSKEEEFKRALGKNIKSLILQNGYNSAYDFWIQNPELDMSRVTLNSLINGQTDARLSSLRKIALVLNLKLNDILKTVE
jgi:hypothetical protein